MSDKGMSIPLLLGQKLCNFNYLLIFGSLTRGYGS